MKKVLNNDMVAHVWAHQQQQEARTANNAFYFYGPTIYSYGSHFPIAKHVRNSKGETAILFTTRGYSNTTAKHINVTWYAIPNKDKVIHCVNPNFTENDNLTAWEREIDNIFISLAKAKKPEKYLLELSNLKAQIERYCTFMEKEIPQPIRVKLEITSKAESIEAVNKAKALKAEQIEKEEKEKQKEINKQLKKFRAFERFNLYGKFSYLRYNKYTQRIETSQRIEIPVEVAKRFYKSIKDNNIENLKILDYTLKAINKQFIEVGCHKIEIKEINKIAKQLNF